MAQPLIKGWQGIAKYLGFTERYIKTWHYNIKKIPFYKSNPGTPQSQIRIEPSLLNAWYKDIIALREHRKLVQHNKFNIGKKKAVIESLNV